MLESMVLDLIMGGAVLFATVITWRETRARGAGPVGQALYAGVAGVIVAAAAFVPGSDFSGGETSTPGTHEARAGSQSASVIGLLSKFPDKVSEVKQDFVLAEQAPLNTGLTVVHVSDRLHEGATPQELAGSMTLKVRLVSVAEVPDRRLHFRYGGRMEAGAPAPTARLVTETQIHVLGVQCPTDGEVVYGKSRSRTCGVSFNGADAVSGLVTVVIDYPWTEVAGNEANMWTLSPRDYGERVIKEGLELSFHGRGEVDYWQAFTYDFDRNEFAPLAGAENRLEETASEHAGRWIRTVRTQAEIRQPIVWAFYPSRRPEASIDFEVAATEERPSYASPGLPRALDMGNP